MAVATGPRFVLEAAFLVVLAVGLGLADLSPVLIVLVMALGWVLVSLIEYFSWRQGPRFPPRFATASPSVLMHEEESAEPPEPAPAPEQPAPPPDEQTAVTPASEMRPAEAESPAEEPAEALQFEVEQRARYSLEPLQPRPRRRWILFGPRERRGEEPGSREEGP